MASLQILKSSAFSPLPLLYSNFPRKSTCLFFQFGSRKRIPSSPFFTRRTLRVCCGVQEGDSQSNGEEPPESLFMKELRRRGMTPTSLLEDSNRGVYGLEEEIKLEEDVDYSKRNAYSTDFEERLSNQRERSMALNSEGLQGLIPRGKLLLTIGGTFFLGFGPLILITIAFFCALYFYFGPSFVHDASKTPVLPPQYIDPYELLEDKRISQIAPHVN